MGRWFVGILLEVVKMRCQKARSFRWVVNALRRHLIDPSLWYLYGSINHMLCASVCNHPVQKKVLIERRLLEVAKASRNIKELKVTKAFKVLKNT
jgi:hypothetical protein